MASHRRRHLYETTFQKPLAGSDELQRKHEGLGAETFILDDGSGDSKEVLWDRRRRRIYETHFKRPYPKSPELTVGKSLQESATAGESTRSLDFDRSWLSSPVGPSNGGTPAYGDIAKEIAPRSLWERRQDSPRLVDEVMVAKAAATDPNDDRMNDSPLPMTFTLGNGEPILPVTNDNHEITKDHPMARTVTPEKFVHSVSMESEAGTDVIMKGTPPSSVSASLERPLGPDGIMAQGGELYPRLVTPNEPKMSVRPTGAPRKQKQVPSPPSLVVWDDEQFVTDKDGQPEQAATATYVSKGSTSDQSPNLESHQSLHQFMKESEEHTLKLYIDDLQESTFDRIVESLYGNTTLKTLVMYRGFSPHAGNYRTRKEMYCFWEAMRCLPNLETVMLLNLREDIVKDLAGILDGHPTLDKIQLHLAEGTVCADTLKALADCPKLKQVQLEVNDSLDISPLLASPIIFKIRIVSQQLMLWNNHAVSMIGALATNTALIALDMEPLLDFHALLDLCRAMQPNKTLQSLKISFVGNTESECDAAAREIANLIRANQSLTTIFNHSHETVRLSGECTEMIMNALSQNYKLLSFTFSFEEPMFWVGKAALLKRNAEYDGTQNISAIFQRYFSCTGLADIPVVDSCRCNV